MRLLPVGRRALLVELGPAGVGALWRRLREDRAEGVEEVVAGARSVLVVVDPDRVDRPRLARELRARAEEVEKTGPAIARKTDPGKADPGKAAAGNAGPAREGPGRTVEIPVTYDGPDLEVVARLTGLSPAEVVRRHQEAVHTVSFLGFSPGFAYLACPDPALAVPRRDSPRPSVPAGSVALAAGMSAVYPSATPGGWQLIGRTATVLFDPGTDPPALLSPGDRVRFLAAPPASPDGPDPARTAGRRRPPRGGFPALEVLAGGPLTTVQDAGRTGWAHAGVPRAGAADAGARRLANRLVGNAEGAALLEATLTGPRLRVLRPVRMALAGARAPWWVDGHPAPHGTAVDVRAGSVVEVGTAGHGVRPYLAVSGGLAVPPVLGSSSRDTLSGLGPPPLAPGDFLETGPAPPPRSGRGGPDPDPGTGEGPAADRLPGDEVVVRADPGPRADWAGGGGLRALGSSVYSVAADSDRVGIRLTGPPVPRRAGEVPPEGMVAGAVQVPPDGMPVILHRNHATTGGYPVVAVVREEDLDLLAQARPGCRLRFELSPSAWARSIW